jgi:hypothetical protein
MRYLVIAIVCLAAGFGMGWLTFDGPFASDPNGTSRADAVEARLLGDVRVNVPDADSASCSPRPASADYLCTVIFGLNGSSADAISTYVVRADGTYRRRP